MEKEKEKIYHLRLTPEGRDLLDKASAATGISGSAICRKVAAKLAKGTMFFSDTLPNIVCLKRISNNVVKVGVHEKYYNAHLLSSPFAIPDMSLPDGIKSIQFRIAVAAACIDIIDAAQSRIEATRRLEAQGKEGVDYNVPIRVLELRELMGSRA